MYEMRIVTIICVAMTRLCHAAVRNCNYSHFIVSKALCPRHCVLGIITLWCNSNKLLSESFPYRLVSSRRLPCLSVIYYLHVLYYVAAAGRIRSNMFPQFFLSSRRWRQTLWRGGKLHPASEPLCGACVRNHHHHIDDPVIGDLLIDIAHYSCYTRTRHSQSWGVPAENRSSPRASRQPSEPVQPSANRDAFPFPGHNMSSLLFTKP
ncbi:hypothetical protein QBC44DRAFT_160620 [Cladorrhinum sp. PSN332]|nr:hypothetical protein QBC44DRAFT_160620 [Cladorrhinum sp. PSN332]